MFTKFHNRERGFTLIELMIVVVIIGILAALAVPRFMRATTKSKQSEAKQLLKQVYTMQRAYRQEHNEYACDGATASATAQTAFADIGVEIGSTALYEYVMAADATTFTCTATANLDDDDTDDEWQIDQDGDLVCNSNDATS